LDDAADDGGSGKNTAAGWLPLSPAAAGDAADAVAGAEAGEAAPAGAAGTAAAPTAAKAQKQGSSSAAAAWAPTMLRRVERCLRRRLELAGCRLADVLLAPPARSAELSDQRLAALLAGAGAGAGEHAHVGGG
jgi:hypothetical protein